MAPRVPLLLLFVLLAAVSLLSITALLLIVNALLVSEATRNAEDAVKEALEHASAIVAAPFANTEPMVRRMALETKALNDRLDDGRTAPAAVAPTWRRYLGVDRGTQAPLYAVYQTFMVNASNYSWTFSGCFPDDNYCQYYRSNGVAWMPATYPALDPTVLTARQGPGEWNYTESHFVQNVQRLTPADAAGRWGTPELFFDNTTNATVPFITFHVPVFFDHRQRCVLSENIDLKADGLKAALSSVELPETKIILLHTGDGSLLATTYDIPSFNKTTQPVALLDSKAPQAKTVAALWPAVSTPNEDLNTAAVLFDDWRSLDRCLPSGEVVKHVHHTPHCMPVVFKSDVVYGASLIRRDTGLNLMIITVTQKSFYFSTLTTARWLGIGIGIACAVVCVAVAALVTVLIKRALQQLQAAMVPAARLKCDPAAYRAQGLSFVADIAELEEAFAVMNDKLHEAGAYLPPAVKTAWAAEDGELETRTVSGVGASDRHDDRSTTLNSCSVTAVPHGPQSRFEFSPAVSPRRQSLGPGQSHAGPHVGPILPRRVSGPQGHGRPAMSNGTPPAVASPAPGLEFGADYPSPLKFDWAHSSAAGGGAGAERAPPAAPPSFQPTVLGGTEQLDGGTLQNYGTPPRSSAQIFGAFGAQDSFPLAAPASRSVTPPVAVAPVPAPTAAPAAGAPRPVLKQTGCPDDRLRAWIVRNPAPGVSPGGTPAPPAAQPAPLAFDGTADDDAAGGGRRKSRKDRRSETTRALVQQPRTKKHRVQCTILHMALLGFGRATDGVPFEDIAKKSAVTADIVLDVCKTHRGVLDLFHGDAFTLTFNAVAPCSSHQRKAAAFVFALRDALEGITARVALRRGSVDESPIPCPLLPPTEKTPDERDPHFELPISCGIASGAALVGDVGSTSMRRLGVLGTAVAQASALERLCRMYNGVAAREVSRGTAAGAAVGTAALSPLDTAAALLRAMGKSAAWREAHTKDHGHERWARHQQTQHGSPHLSEPVNPLEGGRPAEDVGSQQVVVPDSPGCPVVPHPPGTESPAREKGAPVTPRARPRGTMLLPKTGLVPCVVGHSLLEELAVGFTVAAVDFVALPGVAQPVTVGIVTQRIVTPQVSPQRSGHGDSNRSTIEGGSLRQHDHPADHHDDWFYGPADGREYDTGRFADALSVAITGRHRAAVVSTSATVAASMKPSLRTIGAPHKSLEPLAVLGDVPWRRPAAPPLTPTGGKPSPQSGRSSRSGRSPTRSDNNSFICPSFAGHNTEAAGDVTVTPLHAAHVVARLNVKALVAQREALGARALAECGRALGEFYEGSLE